MEQWIKTRPQLQTRRIRDPWELCCTFFYESTSLVRKITEVVFLHTSCWFWYVIPSLKPECFWSPDNWLLLQRPLLHNCSSAEYLTRRRSVSCSVDSFFVMVWSYLSDDVCWCRLYFTWALQMYLFDVMHTAPPVIIYNVYTSLLKGSVCKLSGLYMKLHVLHFSDCRLGFFDQFSFQQPLCCEE